MSSRLHSPSQGPSYGLVAPQLLVLILQTLSFQGLSKYQAWCWPEADENQEAQIHPDKALKQPESLSRVR